MANLEHLQNQMEELGVVDKQTDAPTAKDAALFGAEFIPGVGEAMGVKRISDAVDEGDYIGAGIETAALGLGLIPGAGDLAGKALRQSTKKFRNVAPLEIGASEAAQEGKFLKNYDKSIVDNMKKESSAATAGTKKADALIDSEVPDGTKVGIRLNLNSTIPNMPRGLDKLQTLHKNNYSGKALSYRPFATVEDVTFNVSQKGRQGIAAKIKGIDVPEAKNKFPAMSVDGKLNNTRNVLDEVDDEVVEIGFNPITGHLFTDLATGQAVKGADVATVVGDRVYAKGVTYLKKADAPIPLDATDGTKLSSEVRYRFNEGGMPMKKQMELFELGGLADEGGTKDPVSGNDVPVGSTQKEVRDDIPAQLSEGEFVLPADVVRYHGLEKIMQLRDDAKQGLQKMEDMGQMGNSEEAILDDDVPFSLEDLDTEDDGVLEYNQGGAVTQQGFTGLAGYQPQQYGQTYTQYTPPPIPTTQPLQQAAVPTMPQVPTGQVPTFEQFTKAPEGQAPENREYINPTTGERRTFVFIGGKATATIPEGFIPIADYDPTQAVTPTTAAPKTTTTTQKEEKDEVDDGFGPGGGRVALGGYNQDGVRVDSTLTGVSFSNMGGIGGVAGTAMSAFNLATGKPIPEDATATFTRDNIRINVTGAQFNKMKETNFVGAEADTVAKALDIRSQAKRNKLQVNEETGQIQDQQGNDVSDEVISRIGDTVYDNVKGTSFKDLAQAGKKLSTQEKAIVQKYNDKMFEDFFADEPAPEPQRDDNNDDRPTGGTSISDILSSAPTSSSNEDYAREAFGFSEGGDVTKQMKKSGLSSKK